MQADEIRKALKAIDLGDAGAVVYKTFDFMRVAEDEIERAGGKGSAADCFGALYPGELIRYAPALYRHHCRELIGRAKRGEDLEPGTVAECITVLSRTSLDAPLKPDPANLMTRLFCQVYPDSAAVEEGIRESYAGALDELERDLRRKLSRQRV